jgi:hypothetical protein
VKKLWRALALASGLLILGSKRAKQPIDEKID